MTSFWLLYPFSHPQLLTIIFVSFLNTNLVALLKIHDYCDPFYEITCYDCSMDQISPFLPCTLIWVLPLKINFLCSFDIKASCNCPCDCYYSWLLDRTAILLIHCYSCFIDYHFHYSYDLCLRELYDFLYSCDGFSHLVTMEYNFIHFCMCCHWMAVYSVIECQYMGPWIQLWFMFVSWLM